MTKTLQTLVIVSLTVLYVGEYANAQRGVSTNNTKPATAPSNTGSSGTRLEKFTPAAGSVVIEGYDSLGGVGSSNIGSRSFPMINISARQLRDVATGAKLQGLTIRVDGVTSSLTNSAGSSFIDEDELLGLIKGLDTLLAIKINPTQFKNFNARYTTRGEFQLTVSDNSDGTISYYVAAGRVSTRISAAEMQKLRDLIEEASKILAAR